MKLRIAYILFLLLALTKVNAQEENPFIAYDVPAQNLLKFNRFLINPTFSTVREDKSYINLLHRNQSVQFDDNNQTYFLSYSGRVNDRTGLGLSLYTQRTGILSNYGVLANYAYGLKLSDKSNFTFGANLSYYSSGFDQNRANPVEEDPLLNGFQDSSLLSFQPGFNISYGAFDFGVFAENLFDYNLKTNTSVTEFAEKTYSGHLQYTYPFENGDGILEGARLMPLGRLRLVAQNDLVLGGNLILDLPKLGWLQGGYDSYYGAAAGIGFNLNKRLSLGYTMERALSSEFDNFGLTHEISFAYSFTPTLTEDRVMLEDTEEDLVLNEEEVKADATDEEAEIEELRRRLTENDAILAELMFRQDSIEDNRQKDLERRFDMVMRMVRRETNGERPDVEEKARQMYYINNEKASVAENAALQSSGDTDQYNTSLADRKVLENTITRDAVNVTKSKTPKVGSDSGSPKATDSFSRAIAQEGIKGKKFRNLKGVEDGYYVVANVYKGTEYLNKFLDNLTSQGLQPAYIDNSDNGMKYVYLERFGTWQEALAAHKSKMNGKYTDELWIMNVENKYSNEAFAANAEKVKEKSATYDTDALRTNVVVKDNTAAQEDRNIVIEGLGSGYYIIANVFASTSNANRFVKLLNARGLSASYFVNPQNNYRYVYLKRHDTWNNALVAYYSRLNDTYDDKMWIMRVTPNLIT